MNSPLLNLEPGWKTALADQFDADYMQQLRQFLVEEKAQRKVIYPHSSDTFNALNFTPLEQVKVVILGQDPYHGPDQAHGLCFSVKPGIKTPPSLVNIYKELATDLEIPPANHGYLESWARQGVLLLNSVLTVQQANAASHQGKGWERFTDRIIHILNEQHDGIVFMLWGSYAQKKGAFIDQSRHCVLKAPHPSPLSAHRGFFGCRHFSQANAYLQQHGKSVIDWRLPESIT
ncbi:uracil-DNA glycosylase [Motiliproteus coralliicola]|uniref:Uracil-DNA glycosylase n=1 Tax=Motiliproteus coralliicola TaxID=2283196 RepID=A0A369WXX2_9GAMM|nr:uracil-DNA glycosylase [Motiliproteus coralliicola]RDE25364.1 uracil-DNA glycosylase [Motiliproteus coralliicola]